MSLNLQLSYIKTLNLKYTWKRINEVNLLISLYIPKSKLKKAKLKGK
jgi:hypothetical protein